MKVRASLVRATVIAIIIIAAVGTYMTYYSNKLTPSNETQEEPASQPTRLTSLDQLKALISRSMEIGYFPGYLLRGEAVFGRAGAPMVPTKEVGGYSATNVQVEGIDEADIVKTNGKYIYYCRGNDVVVLDAETLKVVSKISFEGRVNGIYLHNDLLIAIEAGIRPLVKTVPWSATEVMISVYNVSTVESPKLVYSAKVTGNYLSSRLFNGYLYVVTTEPAYIVKDMPVRPLFDEKPLLPARIIYLGGDAGSYTNLLALNLKTFEGSVEALLSSRASRIYMSYDSLYITSYRFYTPFNQIFKEVADIYLGLLPKDLETLASNVLDSSLSQGTKASILVNMLSDHFSSLGGDERAKIARQIQPQLEDLLKEKALERTSVYRFGLEGLNITLMASAEVPGNVLEQFALDERNGTFRMATTSTKIKKVHVEEGNPTYFWPETEPSTGLYVLNKDDLSLMGSVEGLAPGERMHAARYVGDAAFLVTFRRVDPLFAIDLGDPTNPKVIGYTKIPGYSEYLHPYGSYLVGIGPDSDEEGRVKGLKVSLFDISNLENVEEIDVLKIDVPYAGSEVFYDHHTFLKGDGWFGIPVSEAKDYLWIISVNDGGLKDEAKLEHDGVRRGLYIGNTVYTISDDGIRAFEWGTWKEVDNAWFERDEGKPFIVGFNYRLNETMIKIDVSVQLPNPCYKIERGDVKVEDGNILLYANVQEPKDIRCIQVISIENLSYTLEKPAKDHDVYLIVTMQPFGNAIELYLGTVKTES